MADFILPTSESAKLLSLQECRALLTLNSEGKILAANQRFLFLSRYSEAELIGKDFSFLLADQLLIQNFKDATALFNSYSVADARIRCLHKDGTSFWVTGLFISSVTASGEESIVFVCGDCTEHVKAERERDRIIQSLKEAQLFAEFSPEGTFLFANGNYHASFGYAKDGLVGRDRSCIFPAAQLENPSAFDLWPSVMSDEIVTGVIERKSAQDTSVFLESTLIPIKNSSGQLVKVVQLASDITAEILEERSEQNKLLLLSLVANKIENAIVIIGPENKIEYTNASFENIFGYSSKDLPSVDMLFAPTSSSEEMIRRLHLSMKTGEAFQREEITRGKNSQRFWSAVGVSPVLDEDGVVLHTVCIFTDITDVKVHEILQEKALEAMAGDVPLKDVLSLICLEVEHIIPEVIVSIIGLSDDGHLLPLAAPSLPRGCLAELASQVPSALGSSSSKAIFTGKPSGTDDISEDEGWSVIAPKFLRQGVRACWATPIISSSDEVLGSIAFYYHEKKTSDDFQKRLAVVMMRLCALAIEREKTRLKMRKLVYYDELTGLLNRVSLVARGSEIIAQLSATETLSVICIDIDRFKVVNESLGYQAGNEVLHGVGRSLHALCGAKDAVGRISADEFIFLWVGEVESQLHKLIEDIKNVIAQPRMVGDEPVQLSASIGVSSFPGNGEDIDTLIQNATVAMTHAKGKNQVCYFSDEHRVSVKNMFSMENALRSAIGTTELSLYYQPQVFISTGTLYGVEALCRWKSPTFGQVMPSQFIALAEASGLIGALSHWVIEEGCRQLGLWRKAHIDVPTISINLSAHNFQDPALTETLSECLLKNGLTPKDMILELTEGVLLEASPVVLNNIYTAADAGFKFSLDDFGTGYSSLSYLRSLPISEMKLDKSFVNDLQESSTSLRLSRAVMSIGQSLGLDVVAEGIETNEQLNLLEKEGYGVAQGYLYSPALPAEQFVHWYEDFSHKKNDAKTG